MKVSFHKSYFDEREAQAAADAVRAGQVVGGGPRMKRVEAALEKRFAAKHVLATTSCTHALEMAMMLLQIKPGDEVIIPAYTFVSTANCVIRQGAKVVFCDVQESDLNISVEDAAKRITPKTKAIMPVHYAGLPCKMEELVALGKKHNVAIVEDAAQAVDTIYKGKALGTWGEIGCYSFHGSKHVGCGEGGALVTNDDKIAHRAEIIREKGTDRERFLRGEIDKYTWRDEGSSYIPSEVLMAILEVQVSKMDEIRQKREALYKRYREGCADLEKKELLKFPPIGKETQTNYHICHIMLPDAETRERVFNDLRKNEIEAARHYYSLDVSPYAKTFLPADHKELPGAKSVTERLLRLPLYTAMPMNEVDFVVETLHKILK